MKAKYIQGKRRSLILKQNDLAKTHLEFYAENGFVIVRDCLRDERSLEAAAIQGLAPNPTTLEPYKFWAHALGLYALWRDNYSDEVQIIKNFVLDAKACANEAREQNSKIQFEMKHRGKPQQAVLLDLPSRPSKRKKVKTDD